MSDAMPLLVDRLTATDYVVAGDNTGSLRLVQSGQVVRDCRGGLKQQRQEAEVSGRDDLMGDDLPAVHVLSELGNGLGEADGLNGYASGAVSPEKRGCRLAEGDVPVFGASAHDSSSVGGADASVASAGCGDSEPTEEAPVPGREEKTASSVSGDVAAEGPASSRGNGDEATEEVHPAAGRSDSCRSCGAGCGAGLASRSCAGPAHPNSDTPDGGEA